MVKEELVTLSLPYRNGEKTVRVFVPEHEQDETDNERKNEQVSRPRSPGLHRHRF